MTATRALPDVKSIKRWHKKFKETGRDDFSRTGQPSFVEEVVKTKLDMFPTHKA